MQIYMGFSLFSLFIGFVLGASNTPVIGTFVTAIFGLLGSIIAAEYVIHGKGVSTSGKFIGVCLSFVAVALFFGTVFGGLYRSNHIFTSDKELIWSDKNPPSSTKEALDWVLVQEKMSELGYSSASIREIYSIREAEIVSLNEKRKKEIDNGQDESFLTEIYDETFAFHKVFPTSVKVKPLNRAPASIEE